MDLDELKIQLNADAERETVSQHALSKMLKRSSDSVIAGIKKNLFREAVVSLLCTIACFYFATVSAYTSVQIYLYAFAGLCAVFTIVIFALLKMIINREKQVVSLKEKIRSVLHIIRSYSRNYFRFSIALIPVSIALALTLAMNDAGIDHSKFTDIRFMIPFTVAIILLSIGIYFFNKWYIRKLYGRYTEQLEKHAEELENE